MKNVEFDFSEFSSVLTREQMKAVKGGVVCNCPGGGGTTMDCFTSTSQQCVDMCQDFCTANPY